MKLNDGNCGLVVLCVGKRKITQAVKTISHID